MSPWLVLAWTAGLILGPIGIVALIFWAESKTNQIRIPKRRDHDGHNS